MQEWFTGENPNNISYLYYTGELIPYIESVAPASVPKTGTTNISIKGGNFIPTNDVSIPPSILSIGGASSVVYSVISPTEMSAIVTTNNASGSLPVVISNGDRLSNIWGDKSISVISDPYSQNVVLLLRGEGENNSTNIIDSSPASKAITPNGNVKISNIQKKLGETSIYFGRNINSFLSIPQSADWAFAGDFTIEMWIYWDGIESNGGAVVLGTGGSGSIDQLGFFSSALLGYSNLSNSISGITVNTWNHIAVSRNQGNIRGFLNGINRYSQAYTQTIGQSNAPLLIGKRSDNNHPFGGYIDSLRITKNVGRYTSNFDPNTQIFFS